MKYRTVRASRRHPASSRRLTTLFAVVLHEQRSVKARRFDGESFHHAPTRGWAVDVLVGWIGLADAPAGNG